MENFPLQSVQFKESRLLKFYLHHSIVTTARYVTQHTRPYKREPYEMKKKNLHDTWSNSVPSRSLYTAFLLQLGKISWKKKQEKNKNLEMNSVPDSSALLALVSYA